MKITDLEVIPLSIPLRHETPESPWAAGLGRQIVVRVHTDAGITGLGEAFAYGVPLAVCAVIEALKPLLIGADPTQPDVLFDHLSQAALFYGRRGLAADPACFESGQLGTCPSINASKRPDSTLATRDNSGQTWPHIVCSSRDRWWIESKHMLQYVALSELFLCWIAWSSPTITRRHR